MNYNVVGCFYGMRDRKGRKELLLIPGSLFLFGDILFEGKKGFRRRFYDSPNDLENIILVLKNGKYSLSSLEEKEWAIKPVIIPERYVQTLNNARSRYNRSLNRILEIVYSSCASIDTYLDFENCYDELDDEEREDDW